jgi:hypothetical protein
LGPVLIVERGRLRYVEPVEYVRVPADKSFQCKHFIQQNGAETHAPPPPRTSKAPRTQGIGFNQRATQGVGHLFEDTVPDVAHHDDLSGNLPINTGRAAAIEQLVDNLGDVVERMLLT